MDFLFGKKKAAPKPAAPSTNDTLGSLNEQIAQLTKKQSQLDAQIKEAHSQAAARMKAGDKKGAMLQLQRKKRFEADLTGAIAKMGNVEQMISSFQSQVGNAGYFAVMQQSTVALKAQSATMNVDLVAQVKDDFEDLMADQQEMSTMLNESWGVQTYDQDELEDELAALEASELGAEAVAPPSAAVTHPATAAAQASSVSSGAGAASMTGFPSVPVSSSSIAFPSVPRSSTTTAAVTMSMEDELAALEG